MRNLGVIGALAGALGLNGCDSGYGQVGLPVSKETADRISHLVHEERQEADQTVELFNESILNREFTLEEQERVYSGFNNIDSQARSDVLSCDEQNLYNLVNKNLHGIDWGKPELQKALESRGYNSQVESFATNPDSMGVLGIGALAVIGGAFGLTGLMAWMQDQGTSRE